jgi:hypothetical protein
VNSAFSLEQAEEQAVAQQAEDEQLAGVWTEREEED